MNGVGKVRMTNFILLFIVVVLLTIPFLINENSEFMGTDGQAEDLILSSNPEYEPWFAPFWEPPGGEVETLLFTLQAIIGSSVIAYYLGFKKGQKGLDK